MNFSDSGDESCCTSEKRNSLLCFPCFRFNLLRVKVSPLCIYDGDDDSVSHESLPAHLHPWDQSISFLFAGNAFSCCLTKTRKVA